jgi:glutathione S-transferase
MWTRRVDLNICEPLTGGFRYAEGLPMFKDRLLCIPEAAAANKAYARDGLMKLDAALAGRQFVCGDRFTLADILLFAFVDFGASVGQPLPDGAANLKAWYDRIAARPSAAVSANPQNGI